MRFVSKTNPQMWSGLKTDFLYKLRGDEACLLSKTAKGAFTMADPNERCEPDFAAFIGIDWAD